MKMKTCYLNALLLIGLSANVCLADAGTQLKVFPPEITLRGPGDRQTIAVQLVNDQGLTRDVSATVVVKVKDAKIAEFGGGTLKPKKDGETKLLVELGQQKVEVPVTVKDSAATRDGPNEGLSVLHFHAMSALSTLTGGRNL